MCVSRDSLHINLPKQNFKILKNSSDAFGCFECSFMFEHLPCAFSHALGNNKNCIVNNTEAEGVCFNL